MTKKPIITLQQAAFLQDKSYQTSLDKLAIFAQAYRDLSFNSEDEVEAFMTAVFYEEHEIETEFVFINPSHPINLATGNMIEQFLVREIDPRTKAQTIHLGSLAEATRFTVDELNDLPDPYKIYTNDDFLVSEVEAHRLYGDYDSWLKGFQETKVEESEVEEEVQDEVEEVAEEVVEVAKPSQEDLKKVLGKAKKKAATFKVNVK